MKQGWKIKKLSEICTSTNGLWKGKKPPFIAIGVLRSTNFTKDCKIKLDDIAYIEVEEKSFAKRKLQKYDIVVERSGGGPNQPVGRVLLFDIDDENFSFCNFTSALRVNDIESISPIYLHRYLTYFYLSGQTIEMQSNTIALRNLDYTKYLNIDIPIPPLAEQERIVGILDKEFERIDALKANAEQNLQHAKDLFQSALKQELQPKEGWTVKHLEKISTFSQGVQVEIGKQSTEKQDGYMRFLRIVDFTKGNEPPRYVGITDEKYQVKYDSLSVVRYGASAGFICTGLEGVIANNIFRIVPKKDILIGNTYLYYVLISDIFQSVIRDSVNGAAMPAISFGMIKNIDIPYPSIDEQQSIVVRLDKLREHCKALEDNYKKTIVLCDDMKQALLRKAFNGEL